MATEAEMGTTVMEVGGSSCCPRPDNTRDCLPGMNQICPSRSCAWSPPEARDGAEGETEAREERAGGQAEAGPAGAPLSRGRIRDGDLVIMYESHASMRALQVSSASDSLDTRLGRFQPSEWIGLRFGSKVWSVTVPGGRRKGAKARSAGRRGSSYVYLLAPTAELWTLVLPHRTQILYAADIAFVVSALNVSPGSIVLETGTGSGSLTHSLARAVGSTGRVLTYDFHAERRRLMEEELQKHGLHGVVSAHLRDTQQDGFPFEEVVRAAMRARSAAAGVAPGEGAGGGGGGLSADDDGVDGIFLDVPRPFQVVPSCRRVLRFDGRIVSFSPCIEQVQATSAALAKNGFGDIATFETLVRFYATREEHVVTDTESSKRNYRNADSNKRKRGCDGDAGEAAASGAADGLHESRTMLLARPIAETRGHTGYLTVARKMC